MAKKQLAVLKTGAAPKAPISKIGFGATLSSPKTVGSSKKVTGKKVGSGGGKTLTKA